MNLLCKKDRGYDSCEERGWMWIDLPKGNHLIYAQFFNTPVRTLSNIISFVSWLWLVVYFTMRKAHWD